MYIPFLSKERFFSNFYDDFFESNFLEIDPIAKNDSQSPCQSLKIEVTDRKLMWSNDERAISSFSWDLQVLFFS